METQKPRSGQLQEPPVPARRNSATSVRSLELDEGKSPTRSGSQLNDDSQRNTQSGGNNSEKPTPRDEPQRREEQKPTILPQDNDKVAPERSQPRDSNDGVDNNSDSNDNSSALGQKLSPPDSARKQLTNIREEPDGHRNKAKEGTEWKDQDEDPNKTRDSLDQRPRSSPRGAQPTPRTPRRRRSSEKKLGDTLEAGGDYTTEAEHERKGEEPYHQREESGPKPNMQISPERQIQDGENITNNNGDMGVEEKDMGESGPRRDEEETKGTHEPVHRDRLMSEVGIDSGMGSAGEESYSDVNPSSGGTRALVPHTSRSDQKDDAQRVRAKLAEGRQKAFSGKSTLSTR